MIWSNSLLAVVMAICFFVSLVPAHWSVFFAALAAAAVMGCLNNMATSLPASIFGRYDMKRAQSVVLPIMQVLQSIGVGMTGVVADATGGFTAVERRLLSISLPDSLLPPHLTPLWREALEETLAQDPRPAYQNDPERVYHLAFAPCEVHFRVERGVAIVLSIEPEGSASS